MGRRHGDHAAAGCDVSDRRAFDLAGGQKGIRTGAASADGIRRDHGKPAIIRRH